MLVVPPNLRGFNSNSNLSAPIQKRNRALLFKQKSWNIGKSLCSRKCNRVPSRGCVLQCALFLPVTGIVTPT
ncbi:unnamed protein product [Somion occarium]|uniref:Uncharacterized protein n=1 Tax=Somion occarium TaxID=3059160 RepID=A0ABP1DN98_9APHY